MESLWPKLEQLAVNVPIKILQEQVDLFNSQMNGMLSCELERNNNRRNKFLNLNKFEYSASIYVSSPSLIDYRLQIVEIEYSVAKAYPCEVHNCIKDDYMITGMTANNADEFKNILKSVFNSPEVISALQNIIAQGL